MMMMALTALTLTLINDHNRTQLPATPPGDGQQAPRKTARTGHQKPTGYARGGSSNNSSSNAHGQAEGIFAQGLSGHTSGSAAKATPTTFRRFPSDSVGDGGGSTGGGGGGGGGKAAAFSSSSSSSSTTKITTPTTTPSSSIAMDFETNFVVESKHERVIHLDAVEHSGPFFSDVLPSYDDPHFQADTKKRKHHGKGKVKLEQDQQLQSYPGGTKDSVHSASPPSAATSFQDAIMHHVRALERVALVVYR